MVDAKKTEICPGLTPTEPRVSAALLYCRASLARYVILELKEIRGNMYKVGLNGQVQTSEYLCLFMLPNLQCSIPPPSYRSSD